MKDVFIVIGYDSIFDAEEVAAVFFNKKAAEKYRKENKKLRVETHTVTLIKEDQGCAHSVDYMGLVQICELCGEPR